MNDFFFAFFRFYKGIVIRVGGDSVKLMHNKFCLIDVLNNEAECLKNSHPTNGVLINGSFNWTTNVSIFLHCG